MSKTKTPNTKQAIIEVLKAAPEATVAQIAVSANVGRSTAGKMLAQMEGDGEVRRTEGGRDGNRRQPDLWSLAGAQPASTGEQPASGKASDSATTTGKPAAASAGDGKPSDGKAGVGAASATGKPGKLKPNELNALVLGFLEANKGDGPHGPGQVAKALERSSGAVGNCLERLANDKKVMLVTEKPRRYSIA
ncbi:MAG TPA: helix-turn-helix domain-containing protein [Solirubrobacteraceae bacterium]|nr:helix-turn-helix domain-containing protein [Solirubrobacteraceae bacterium]